MSATQPTSVPSYSDITIIGAGPAGLSMARALAPSGLNITLIEQLPLSTLQSPPFDGREIALTHYSKELLQQLNIWQHIPNEQIYPLRDARVVNGYSTYQLHFKQPTIARGQPADTLGFLISNHHIRQAAYETLQPYQNIRFVCQHRIQRVSTDHQSAQVILANGQIHHSQLVVAADSRFSDIRRQLGISAQMHDFGRTVLVFRMRHSLSNQHSAYECFHYGRTIALLPLEPTMTNCVVTLDNQQCSAFLNRDTATIAQDIEQALNGLLGRINIVSQIHHYPLVTVHANAFYAQRAALIGDAAVGMHPVTAHGFNLGLAGVNILSQLIMQAHNHRQTIASDSLLRRYQAQHMPHTRILYHSTNAMVSLFTQDALPARWLRHLVLRTSNHLFPLKQLISKQLTG